MSRLIGGLVMLWFGLTGVAALADVQRVTLAPLDHARASLTIEGPAGTRVYTPLDLEAAGAARMETITPWREEPATFDGVLLTDILRENAIEDADAIRVIAENGYAVEIERRVWERWPILIATRVNGAAHSRRSRGPLQFVLPMSDDPEAGASHMASNWVWMAERIELVR